MHQRLTALIEGNDGWPASLARAESQLSEINDAIKAQRGCGEIDDLRKQRADAAQFRDVLAGIVECLQRLANDLRMRGAFELLAKEFTDDEQWRGFISAAWAAHMDYRRFRDRLRRTAELRDEIARTAGKLAKLLRDAEGTGFSCWPSEFFDIPDLLRKTDNHEMQGHNLHMWQIMRCHVLGDPPRYDNGESDGASAMDASAMDAPSLPEIRFLAPGEKPEIDPAEQARNTLRYAWEKAPSLPALLDTVVAEAQNFVPREYGMIGAAIESRQQNTKTEYLRAFRESLEDVHGLPITNTVMMAMAIVATVVIDKSGIEASYDDVRKALRK